MNASAKLSATDKFELLRWSGRISGVVLFATWILFVIGEAMWLGLPTRGSVYQAAALAMVFAGYAIGWRYELVGGILAVVGTAAFVAVYGMTFGSLPLAHVLWFAVPGGLYLLAWAYKNCRPVAEARLT
jgi:hypothetical protein